MCSIVVMNSWCIVLQDRVPAFSAEKAMSFIENELGAPVNALFADFELQPIAAASLGQVGQVLEMKSTTASVKNTSTILDGFTLFAKIG